MTKIKIAMRIHMREIVLLMEALQWSKRFKERWVTTSSEFDEAFPHLPYTSLASFSLHLPKHIYLKTWSFTPKPIEQSQYSVTKIIWDSFSGSQCSSWPLPPPWGPWTALRDILCWDSQSSSSGMSPWSSLARGCCGNREQRINCTTSVPVHNRVMLCFVLLNIFSSTEVVVLTLSLLAPWKSLLEKWF